MMYLFKDPYSPQGLRMRAEKLPDCAYKIFLELTATQLENKKINKQEAKKAIEYARTNDSTLLSVAIKILNLDTQQVDKALEELKELKQ